MIFPKDFPDKLRSSILVSEVVGKKVKLRQNGKEFSGLCPFHDEKTPSFTVNDQKGFYHCFGCAAHGDIIKFTMEKDGMEFKDAVVHLADEHGIAVPQVEKNFQQNSYIDREFLIIEKICEYFENNLAATSGRNALEYLQKRGISANNIKKFRLGFAPNSYDALIEFLRSQKFSEKEISKTGVVGLNKSNKLYCKFRNRVIFPITDKKNRVIAFGGRTIADEMPKYLNSAETSIFKKSQTLYNAAMARKSIFSKKYVVVVEGYMDAISLYINGIENVVAGLGTALGQDHIKDLFYTTDRIVICLDGDIAGVRAAKRSSELVLPLISAKKNIAFTFLPNELDPDDFIQEFGAKALENQFIDAKTLSQSLFDFTLDDLGIDKSSKISPEIKAKIEISLENKIKEIQDATSRKYFSLFFKDLLFYLGRNSKKFDKKTPANFSNNRINKFSNDISHTIDLNIIALILRFPKFIDFHNEDYDIRQVEFFSEDMTNLKESVIEVIESDENDDLGKIFDKISQFCEKKPLLDLKNIVRSITSLDEEFGKYKLSILLLKDSLLQIEGQYKEALNKIDDIQTHQSAITDQKIKEIFDYKNSLEAKIMSLEKEYI